MAGIVAAVLDQMTLENSELVTEKEHWRNSSSSVGSRLAVGYHFVPCERTGDVMSRCWKDARCYLGYVLAGQDDHSSQLVQGTD